MKKLIFFILSLPLFVFSQVPQGVGYQGVATDALGIELVNQSISIRASVLSGSSSGTIEWQETHNTSTDTFGLFNLTIGQGTSTGNGTQTSFVDISWGANTHFLKIEMDVNGGTNYSHMGTNQMMSVPYALYAENANIDYDSISTLLSNDSTFITTVSGGVGGGCDFNYPDGFNGDGVTISLYQTDTYTVPVGKRLYILLHTGNTSPLIDGINAGLTSNSNESKPAIINSGQVISNSNTSSYSSFHGILIDENPSISAISMELNSSSSYIVPFGKKLYVLISQGSAIIIDGENTYSNYDKPVPIILNSGQVLTCSNIINFNGYLADEGYFADCGGNGSSLGPTIDSSYIDSLVQFYSTGSVGGCNFNFPEGLDGEVINQVLTGGISYTVPNNKRLYLTNMYHAGLGIRINGTHANYSSSLHLPLIVNPGDIITQYNTGSTPLEINGFIVDTISDITSINQVLTGGISYTVPNNKRLYITNMYHAGLGIRINGTHTNYSASIHLPLIVKAGDIITQYNTGSTPLEINGYIVDENYFTDCLGSSNSSSSVTSPNIFYYPTSSYYVIPNGISIVEITLVGAVGGIGGSNLLCNSNSGNSSPGGLGGIGGMINFLLPCNAGDSLFFNIGINGSNGTNASSECINGTSGAVGGSATVSLNGVLVATANGGNGGGPGSCLCGYYGNSPGTVGSNGGSSISLSSAIEMDSGINDGAKAILKL